jgi:zinc/manganese transport system ATP-binding protein
MREQRATASQDDAHPGTTGPAPDSVSLEPVSLEPVSLEPVSPAPEVTLAVNGVSVRLGGREVLHDVRFTIRRGEFVGLIGANGAGKTTLMRVILGLVQPSAGEVRIGGRPRRKRAGIGYVPQKIQLDPDMPLRARDLIGLGLDGHRLGFPLPSRSRRAMVDEMLRAVDAEHLADARVGNLSGGEQQRILIAHALISRPGLLLLDEPLANLDIASEQEVIALLSRISRQQQVAVLISAHEMNPLLPVMDRVVYMAEGRAASGPTDEVIQDEVLTELYGRHVDVIRVQGRVLVVAGREDGLGSPGEPAGALSAADRQPGPVRAGGAGA